MNLFYLDMFNIAAFQEKFEVNDGELKTIVGNGSLPSGARSAKKSQKAHILEHFHSSKRCAQFVMLK